MARKSKELEELSKIIDEEYKLEEQELESLDLDESFLLSIQENASYMTDKRYHEYTVHSLESILLLVILALIADCNNFVQIQLFMYAHKAWLLEHINFDAGLPSLSTIKRVIAMINPSELENVINSSLQLYITKNEPYYEDVELTINDLKSMDGKTANSSSRNKSSNGKIAKTNAMSLYSIKNDICEATEFIDKKTNEIPTGVSLLKKVNIKDCIIVFDAMSTQINTIEYIANNGAYYVAPVKGNQGSLEESIKLFFDDETNFIKEKGKNYLKNIEKRNGDAEIREYCFTNDINWIYKKGDWKGLKSIGYAKRTYTNKEGKKVTDTRYFITNIDANKINLLSNSIRGEWQIENGLHLYLDISFLEDKNTCFLDNSQKNLNLIRKFVLALLKRYKINTKLSLNSIRFNVSMNFEKEVNNILKKILS